MKPVKNKLNNKISEAYDQLLKKWDIEYNEVDLIGEYGITHVILSGDENNTPLVLLHGRDSNSAVEWSNNIAKLSEKFYCIAADLYGEEGKSISKRDNTKVFDTNKWMDSILMELNIGKCYMLGIDSGAAIALRYTIYNPNVNKTICMDRELKPINSLFRSAKMLLIAHESKFMRKYNFDEYGLDDIKSIKAKLYFIFGSMSIDSKLDEVNFITQENFKYVIIDNSGKNVNFEQPQLVNREIINFLA